MGSLLDRLSGTKAWSQPPFWSLGAPVWGTTAGEKERIANDYDAYVREAYKASGVIFTCSLVRMQVFSQINFRIMADDGRLRRDANALSLLEEPWPNGTTGDLLGRMEQSASLAGNEFLTRRRSTSGAQRIRRLRPDWVTIITGSPTDDPFDIDAEVLGYIYDPKVARKRTKPVFLTPAEVVHWAPIPDPDAQWRGMSWLTPVLREIEADKAATAHKLRFFERGTTSNLAIVYDKSIDPTSLKRYREVFAEAYEGVDNAYKTLHIGGGADPRPIGANLRELEFKATQGAGETRIAAASGVGAIIAQFSEGMQGSSLNAGNYGAARRRFSDITMQHLWQTAAAALSKFVDLQDGERLWFDRDGVPFLQEDEKDAAEIVQLQVATIAALVREGFVADGAVEAVIARDLSKLVGAHSGRSSVQLHDTTPGEETDAEKARRLVEMVQKVYLGVDVVLTPDEAREILNRAGAGLTGALPAEQR